MFLRDFGSIPSQAGEFWLDGYDYCKEMTISADNVDADLTNIPVPVCLRDTASGSLAANFDFALCQADGSDIRFTDKNNNLLKFERKEHGTAIYGTDQCSGGTAIAHAYYSSYLPSKAFDDDNSTRWRSTSVPSSDVAYFGYVFTTAKAIRKIVSTSHTTTGSYPPMVKVQYSNDGLTWSDATQDIATSAAAGAVNTLYIDYVGAHTHWRVLARANGASYWSISEAEMMEAVSYIGVYNVLVPSISSLTDTKIYMWHGSASAYNASIEAWQDMTGKALTYNGHVKIVRNSASDHYASFDGTEDYFALSGQSDFAFGTGDFCIELKFKTMPSAERQVLYDSRAGAEGAYVSISVETSNKVRFMANGGTSVIYSTTTLAAGTAYKIKVAKISGVIKLYLNDVQEGGNLNDATAFLNGANRPLIGGCGGDTTVQGFNGAVYGVRVTKGRSRSTDATPDTFDIDGTDVVFCTNFDTVYDRNYVMVQHMGDTLVDASGNGNNGTATGTTVVDTEFGKVRNFNGTSDLIEVPQAVAAPFDVGASSTLLMLAMSTNVAATNNQQLWHPRNSGNDMHLKIVSLSPSKFDFGYYNGTEIFNYSGTITSNEYYALCGKIIPNQMKLFLDSVLSVTGNSYNPATVTGKNTIGAQYITSAMSFWAGHIGETRISNIARSDAYIKVESLALKDSLLTYAD